MDLKAKIEEFIINEICSDAGLDIKSIDENEPLIDSGIIDSLGILQILSFLDEELGIDISPISADGLDLNQFASIKVVCEMIENLM